MSKDVGNGAGPGGRNAKPGLLQGVGGGSGGGPYPDLYSGNRDDFTSTHWSGNVSVNIPKDVAATASTIFKGSVPTTREWGQLFGAPDGATVNVAKNAKGELTIKVDHPWYDKQTRIIRRDEDGKLAIYNGQFEVTGGLKDSKGEALRGIGTRVSSYSMEMAKRMGFDYAETYAAGKFRDVKNGYYTWARTGYTAEIPQQILDKLPPIMKSMRIKTTNDLMLAMPDKPRLAANFWKINGRAFQGRFDLADNSVSWKVNKAYRAENKMKLGFDND